MLIASKSSQHFLIIRSIALLIDIIAIIEELLPAGRG